MIDARECEAMARQFQEEAHEAAEEASACLGRAQTGKAERWRRVAEAHNDAAEACFRAANEIEAVSTER